MKVTQKQLKERLFPYSTGMVQWSDPTHLKLVTKLQSISRWNVYAFHSLMVPPKRINADPIEIRLEYLQERDMFLARIVYGKGNSWLTRVKDKIKSKDLHVVKRKIGEWLRKHKWNWQPKETVAHFRGDMLSFRFKFDKVDLLLWLGGK